jgi:hypothetical protein
MKRLIGVNSLEPSERDYKVIVNARAAKILPFLAENHIGPRTMLKSYRTYLKCQVGKCGKGINCFVLNGNLDVKIGNNAVVENWGNFWFGINNSVRRFKPSTVAGSLYLARAKDVHWEA